MAAKRETIEGDVLVPSLQAGVIAAAWASVVGLLSGGVTILARWPWWVVPLSTAVVVVGVFAWRVTSHINERRSLWLEEKATGNDLDFDGHIGRPPDDGVRLAFVHDPRRQQRVERSNDFRFFLREGFNGRGLTWRQWDSQRLPSGRRVTRPLWEMYTGRLQKAGLATRPYSTAALELNADYRTALSVFREIL